MSFTENIVVAKFSGKVMQSGKVQNFNHFMEKYDHSDFDFILL